MREFEDDIVDPDYLNALNFINLALKGNLEEDYGFKRAVMYSLKFMLKQFDHALKCEKCGCTFFYDNLDCKRCKWNFRDKKYSEVLYCEVT